MKRFRKWSYLKLTYLKIKTNQHCIHEEEHGEFEECFLTFMSEAFIFPSRTQNVDQ